MVFFSAPAAVLSLLALSFLPSSSATLLVRPTPAARLNDFERLKLALARRQECAGTPCGYYNQLCCTGGAQCYTDANTVAQCSTGGSGWVFSTYFYTAAETVTKQSVWSTYIGASPTGSACNPSDICGTACCGSGQWCADASNNICKEIGGGSAGSPGVTGTGTNPSAPVRPTSNGVIVITATGSATATVPFTTPIPTGVNGTLVESEAAGGLSGGAIAGIVIGVIAGIILLLLICFYCCAKAAFDGILAMIGLGKKRRHTHEETTYIEEHHSGAAAGGRRWYGQAGSARPSRPARKEGGGMGRLLGIGAGAAALGAMLGMRKKNERKHYDDKSTTITDSSYYYSDYTSSSESILRNQSAVRY